MTIYKGDMKETVFITVPLYALPRSAWIEIHQALIDIKRYSGAGEVSEWTEKEEEALQQLNEVFK